MAVVIRAMMGTDGDYTREQILTVCSYSHVKCEFALCLMIDHIHVKI